MEQCTYEVMGIRCERETGHDVDAEGHGHEANVGAVIEAMARGTITDVEKKSSWEERFEELQRAVDERMRLIRAFVAGSSLDEAMVIEGLLDDVILPGAR